MESSLRHYCLSPMLASQHSSQGLTGAGRGVGGDTVSKSLPGPPSGAPVRVEAAADKFVVRSRGGSAR